VYHVRVWRTRRWSSTVRGRGLLGDCSGSESAEMSASRDEERRMLREMRRAELSV